MTIRSQLAGFWRALRSGTGARRRPRHGGDALARTAQDALGGRGIYSGAGFVDRSRIYDHISEGADDYDKSFDD